MLIFILLLVVGALFIVSTSKERQVMRDVDRIAKDNEKVMWEEIKKNNEKWKK